VLAGAYLRLWPAWVSRYALERHRSEGRAVIVNVHPWEVDPEQPVVGPSRRATWTHYARLDRTEGILRSILARDRFRDAASRLRQIGLLPSHEQGAHA